MVKNGSVFRLQEECLVNNFSEFSSSFGTIITEWREKNWLLIIVTMCSSVAIIKQKFVNYVY